MDSRRPAAVLQRLECVHDFVDLGEALGRLLREDEPTLGEHVELTAAARHDRRGVLGAPFDLGRETRSPFVVAVSDRAVVDLDVHSTQPTRRS